MNVQMMERSTYLDTDNSSKRLNHQDKNTLKETEQMVAQQSH